MRPPSRRSKYQESGKSHSKPTVQTRLDNFSIELDIQGFSHNNGTRAIATLHALADQLERMASSQVDKGFRVKAEFADFLRENSASEPVFTSKPGLRFWENQRIQLKISLENRFSIQKPQPDLDQNGAPARLFVRTGPRYSAVKASFLSDQNLGFKAKIPNFCPARGLGCQEINRGPITNYGLHFGSSRTALQRSRSIIILLGTVSLVVLASGLPNAVNLGVANCLSHGVVQLSRQSQCWTPLALVLKMVCEAFAGGNLEDWGSGYRDGFIFSDSAARLFSILTVPVACTASGVTPVCIKKSVWKVSLFIILS
ncbi:hypothetical protein B0H19DRAFT_1063122 [Mycena capillaripes]|nr:hypothetical protein B0H19DRAFT_1063122 [Mycena capillaripes]